VPSWIKERQDIDEMARRRCLMILSVLSGETPVSDAIEQHQISRQLYYDLEARALSAMVQALMPGDETNPAGMTPAARIAELEKQVATLEQGKRRSERLLMMTRQLMKPGSLKAKPRKRHASASSTSPGKLLSPSSTKTTDASTGASPSTPTKDGEDAH
jgi:hypothetical protein